MCLSDLYFYLVCKGILLNKTFYSRYGWRTFWFTCSSKYWFDLLLLGFDLDKTFILLYGGVLAALTYLRSFTLSSDFEPSYSMWKLDICLTTVEDSCRA